VKKRREWRGEAKIFGSNQARGNWEGNRRDPYAHSSDLQKTFSWHPGPEIATATRSKEIENNESTHLPRRCSESSPKHIAAATIYLRIFYLAEHSSIVD
jgi:hypothetical protein